MYNFRLAVLRRRYNEILGVYISDGCDGVQNITAPKISNFHIRLLSYIKQSFVSIINVKSRTTFNMYYVYVVQCSTHTEYNDNQNL